MANAILFDLDGTLVDTLTDLANTANAVLIRFGYPSQPLESYRRFVGSGARLLMERASGETDEGRITALFEAFVEEYDRRCLETVHPYEGVLETLQHFKERGFAMGVVTNKPHRQAQTIVQHLFGDMFGCLFGGCADYPRKPDPQIVHLAAKALGVDVADCVFVGDSDVDVLTAHAAGIPCVGCAFGFRGEEELKNAGADRIVYSFTELQNLG
ncbi:MAG: HAD-IA family hydrolase [Clostridia bacterium]|nr:HAD-IA family hydrolase [Clostridia bacterium]